MKNQKLQNFFRTLFFKGNNKYLPVVLLFWFDILIIILDVANRFLSFFYYGGYSASWFDNGFGNYIGISAMLFSIIYPYSSDLLIGLGLASHEGGFLCLWNCYNFTIVGKIIVFSGLLIFVLFINFIAVKLYNLLVAKFVSRKK